jgi:hypothetical protein
MLRDDSMSRHNQDHLMTPHNPQKHNRCSIRLQGYETTQPGAYFITFVAWQRNYYEHIIRDDREFTNIRRFDL